MLGSLKNAKTCLTTCSVCMKKKSTPKKWGIQQKAPHKDATARHQEPNTLPKEQRIHTKNLAKEVSIWQRFAKKHPTRQMLTTMQKNPKQSQPTTTTTDWVLKKTKYTKTTSKCHGNVLVTPKVLQKTISSSKTKPNTHDRCM